MPRVKLTAWGAYAINAAVRESMPQFREPVLAHLFIGQPVDEATLLLILPQEAWGAIPPFSDVVNEKICNGPNPMLNAVLARLASEHVVAEAPESNIFKTLGITLRIMRGVTIAGEPDLSKAAVEALRRVFGDFSRSGGSPCRVRGHPPQEQGHRARSGQGVGSRSLATGIVRHTTTDV